jgi:hypothetical protein
MARSGLSGDFFAVALWRPMTAVHPSPLAIANAVVRNLVPLAGILFLGWSAANVLILYFVDTLLAMAVMFAGSCATSAAADRRRRAAAPRPRWAAGVALAICALLAAPGCADFHADGQRCCGRELLTDPGFRRRWCCRRLPRSVVRRSLSCVADAHARRMRPRQFALVFLRWMVVIMVSYLGIGVFLGRYAAFFFVAIYGAATFMIEVAPDRFLRAMPGGAEDADPLRSNPNAPASRDKRRLRKKR